MVLLMEDDLHLREKYTIYILMGLDSINYVAVFISSSHLRDFTAAGRSNLLK